MLQLVKDQPNQALERTATRFAFTSCLAKPFRSERRRLPVAVAQLFLVRLLLALCPEVNQ